MSKEAYEACPCCGGSGMQANSYSGEAEHCHECKGNTVVRARDRRGRFKGRRRVEVQDDTPCLPPPWWEQR